MTPSARVQAAIDCLDAIVHAAREGGAAADTLIARYFQTRRYAGSKDRRAVRELIYAVIRSIGERPATGRSAMLAHARAHDPALLDLFEGGTHGPAPHVEGEPEARPGPAPAWLIERLRRRFGADTDAQLAALLDRAPLDLRVNTLKTTRDAIEIDADPVPLIDTALRVRGDLNVETLPAFHDGLIEVQDAGSQFAAAACEAKPGETVLDLCAGAGGKTLALAATMGGEGRLIAADTDRARLRQLEPRAVRAGAEIETRLLNPGKEMAALGDLQGACDLVLVDAPCSGTGTWRRNPEARWRLTPDRLARFVAEQGRLLKLAAGLVKPGGRIVYVVCSLLPEEGEGVVADFLAQTADVNPLPLRNPLGGAPVSKVVLTPGTQGCDGFFLGGLIRIC
ncbi:RsmB/NOP family class I SAM-dependent RNA methyltransferase [Glacieibacterium frigidum]|uniref:RsmB/NOP family class I SAM-dependent RNA methyltransferase n=1 Tax=Glacieibacterium frigidum TaxID=2593303 RepID=A0A552UJ57_9SPHN|nr:RsmB/NOP family class I SAM-dependent RNA methyltransferase [Glacieibacterium frigidum]TRW18257.1 RsmB/NOP family class I SAM-dependent RNA methyltransferase [Glacieibacterium frigidum]